MPPGNPRYIVAADLLQPPIPPTAPATVFIAVPYGVDIVALLGRDIDPFYWFSATGWPLGSSPDLQTITVGNQSFGDMMLSVELMDTLMNIGCGVSPLAQTQSTTTESDQRRDNSILVSHYTSNNNAETILANQEIRVNAPYEENVFVMVGRSNAQRARAAGAVLVEARIVFDATIWELEEDPEQTARKDRIRKGEDPYAVIIEEAKQFRQQGPVQLRDRNACKERPIALGIWTRCR